MKKCIRAEEPGSALTYAMGEEIAAEAAPTKRWANTTSVGAPSGAIIT